MKILQITYSLTSGGAERLVLDLSNELASNKNNEVHLLTILNDTEGDNDFYKDLLSKNVQYHCANENRGINIPKVIRINRIVKKINPDIVHFHGNNIILFFLPLILFKRKFKYVETVHNSGIDLNKRWFFIIIAAIYKLNLVKMVTISDINKRGWEKILNINNTTLIYNGRSLPEKSALFDTVKSEIDALKKNEDTMVFIHVGRCAPVKNQKMLVTVFNTLYKKNQHFILLIIGDGFDSEMGKEIQEVSNPNIYYLGTKLNIIDYFLCADAFCLSSTDEGMPISLIEAFACECVPVCTPTSGSSDLILDGVNGFIAEDFSEIAYLNTIERFIEQKDNIDKNNLQKTYFDNFFMNKCVDSYQTVYEKIVKPKKNK